MAPFRYIRIPADAAVPVEELLYSEESTLENDTFAQHLRTCFGQGEVDTALLKAQVEQHMNSSMNGGEAISAQQMATLVDSSSMDILCVALPSADTDFHGVSLYVDDKSVAKNLPLNARANAFAQDCGLLDQELRGDVYLSRVLDDEQGDRWGRLDLCASELTASSSWVEAAARANRRRGAQGAASMSSLLQAQGGGNPAIVNSRQPASEPIEASTEFDGGRVVLNEADVDEIECRFERGDGVKLGKKDVAVVFGASKLTVKMHGKVVLECTLVDKVRPGDCTWTLADGNLVVILSKMHEGRWGKLAK